MAPCCRYGRAVPQEQIKGVPADVHAELRQRAARAGQALQEYLLGRLPEEARTPSLNDLLDRMEQHTGGRFFLQEAVAAVREERSSH